MTNPNGWTRTNAREQHYRVDGKILGKISRRSGGTWWTAKVRVGSKREMVPLEIGVSEATARTEVERWVARREQE